MSMKCYMNVKGSQIYDYWSKTTLSYQLTVEGYPNLKEEVGNSIPGCEIFSLPDGKLAKWSIASHALALACRPSVLRLKKLI
jgi:hypothetical protein